MTRPRKNTNLQTELALGLKKSRSRRNMGPSEHQLQTALFNQIRAQTPFIPELANSFAVPNGFFVPGEPGARVKQHFVDEGLSPGVPDLFLMIPRGKFHALAIEMKTPVGSLADDQKTWRARLEAQGYRWELCRSTEEAWEVIKSYLKTDCENDQSKRLG